MKGKQTYYHILEIGNYGEIGYQGYEENLSNAQLKVNLLSDTFENLYFEIFSSDTKDVPPIITV
jgi:hypothetical protein